MPEVAVRTRTERSEGDVYQHGSLSRNCPSRGGHETQPCSIQALHQWLGEEVRAPSFPWPHPAATGEPQPSPSSHGSYTWTREMYFPDMDCGGGLCSGEGAAAGSGAPCQDAAHLQGCHENRPRSRSERGGDAERGAAGRLGSIAQARSREEQPEARSGEVFGAAGGTGRWREATGNRLKLFENQENKSALTQS